ncbi:MAG: hypothetical protein IJX99_02210 [Clostridia bacterium]|nr:hypothetical protein [Clostridia bacterium]
MIGQTNAIEKVNAGIDYVEYIQSSGTQYINTGLKPTQNTRIVCEVVDFASKGAIFGVDNGWLTQSYTVFPNISAFGTASYDISNYVSNGTIDFSKNGLIHNGSTVWTPSTSDFTSLYELTLFALNRSGATRELGSGKLKYLQYYEADVLVRDFKPCKDKNGTYCLYDEVSKTYFYNAGTGSFIGG